MVSGPERNFISQMLFLRWKSGRILRKSASEHTQMTTRPGILQLSAMAEARLFSTSIFIALQSIPKIRITMLKTEFFTIKRPTRKLMLITSPMALPLMKWVIYMSPNSFRQKSRCLRKLHRLQGFPLRLVPVLRRSISGLTRMKSRIWYANILNWILSSARNIHLNVWFFLLTKDFIRMSWIKLLLQAAIMLLIYMLLNRLLLLNTRKAACLSLLQRITISASM